MNKHINKNMSEHFPSVVVCMISSIHEYQITFMTVIMPQKCLDATFKLIYLSFQTFKNILEYI